MNPTDAASFTPQQLAVERVIRKVFTKYGITISVTDNTRHVFQVVADGTKVVTIRWDQACLTSQ